MTWQKANLVHGDFSPYNIMWHGDKPVVIDVGQAVIQSHPRSQEFLVRDVTELVEWANKSGIEVELAEAMFDVLEMDLSHVQIHEEVNTGTIDVKCQYWVIHDLKKGRLTGLAVRQSLPRVPKDRIAVINWCKRLNQERA